MKECWPFLKIQLHIILILKNHLMVYGHSILKILKLFLTKTL